MFKTRHSGAQPESATLHQLTALVSGRLLPGEIPIEQWPELTDLAMKNGLGPMLLWSVKRSGVNPLPDKERQSLVKSAYLTAIADTEFENSLHAITLALASVSIPAIWLKGAALARSVYPQPALRPMGDLDVLVPYEKRQKALDVLRSLGYKFDAGTHFHSGNTGKVDKAHHEQTAFHHYMLTGGKANSVLVELHFRLTTYGNERLSSGKYMDWFWEHTRAFYLNDRTACTGFTPESHLLYLAAHNIFQHSESRSCLIRDLDLHLLITQYSLDWNMIIDQAVVMGWTHALSRALERAIAFFDTPVPEKVLKELARCLRTHDDISLAFQKKVPGSRWIRVKQNLSHLSARGKMSYFLQSLFPTADYMRYRYSVPANRSIWPYYPYRWFDQSREITRAIRRGQMFNE